jgi:peptidoglycan/LPS O-acetylase OafA/YrhL
LLPNTNLQGHSNKLAKLEAVRGFAAVYVVLHHLFSARLFIGGKDFSFLFRFGQEAVILFFLLSGFVIQYAYNRSGDKTFNTFFLKRFLRIYIPLTIIFFANYLVLVIEKKHFFSLDWLTLTGNIFMLQDNSFLKPNVICDPFLGNSPLWSLSYEWWFYMLFFVIQKNIRYHASNIVYTVGTLSALTYLIYPFFINRELMYLVIWWVGASMATLISTKKEISVLTMKIPLIALLANVSILALNVKLNNKNNATIGVSPFLELRHFSFALATTVLAILWKRMKWFGFNNTIGLFKPFASISFGLYISHWFLIAKAHYLDFAINNIYVRLSIYTVICLLFSYLVERVIYTRLNRWALIKFEINSLRKKLYWNL